MKIVIDPRGATPARPDFGMIRAGLAAAQAMTPTAAACERREAPVEPVEALTRLFADNQAADEPQSSLTGSFNPGQAVSERER